MNSIIGTTTRGGFSNTIKIGILPLIILVVAIYGIFITLPTAEKPSSSNGKQNGDSIKQVVFSEGELVEDFAHN